MNRKDDSGRRKTLRWKKCLKIWVLKKTTILISNATFRYLYFIALLMCHNNIIELKYGCISKHTSMQLFALYSYLSTAVSENEGIDYSCYSFLCVFPLFFFFLQWQHWWQKWSIKVPISFLLLLFFIGAGNHCFSLFIPVLQWWRKLTLNFQDKRLKRRPKLQYH